MKASAPTAIDSQDLNAVLDSPDQPRVLAGRIPGVLETMHVPSAYSVPLDLLRERRDAIVQHLDRDVVLVCRPGQSGPKP